MISGEWYVRNAAFIYLFLSLMLLSGVDEQLGHLLPPISWWGSAGSAPDMEASLLPTSPSQVRAMPAAAVAAAAAALSRSHRSQADFIAGEES